MIVKRSAKGEAWAMAKIKAWLERRPRSQEKWHVSDLLYPLKAYWGRVKPKPITDLEALYFVAGIGHHSVVEAMLGPKKAHGRADSGEFEKSGILFSPDLRLPYPLEFKTSRAEHIPGDNFAKSFDGYLKQETSYQALMKSAKGALCVLYLAARTPGTWGKKPALRVYEVNITPAEMKAKEAELVKSAALLTKAVKNKKPDLLELCPDWQCRGCKWFTDCKPWKRDPKRKNAQEKK